MAYTRQYTQGVGWQNEPSVNTPINAENLNQMDMAIQDVDEAAYNEFLAVYEAISHAGGGSSVNFYIDNASNNTLSSQTSVLSNVTLKANDLIFLYMSVDGTYTSPTGGWAVSYTMDVDDTPTAFTATIVDYLHGEGAMWHDGFSANLVQGTWLILRVVSATIFDCIARINPESTESGTGKPYSGLLGGADGQIGGVSPSETLTNYLALSVDSSFELVDGACVLFRRANGVGFSSQVQEGAQLYLNVNNTGSKPLRDYNLNEIEFTDDMGMNDYFRTGKTFIATYHKYDTAPYAYDFWELSSGGTDVSGEFAGYDDNNYDLVKLTINGEEWNIHPTDVKVYTSSGASDSHIDSDNIRIFISEWEKWSDEDSVIYFRLEDGVTVDWTSNGLVVTIVSGIGHTMAFDVYYHGTKVTSASVFPIVQNAVYMLVSRADSELDAYVFDIFDITSTSGGGGTTVIANPSDPASSDLEKLQVGNTIYAINAGNSAEGNKITSALHTDPDKLVTNIQLDSGIAEHEGDVFYLTSELNTGTSQYGWNVQLQYAVSDGYADVYIPLFGMNPSTVMDIFSGNIAAGDILVVKVTHSGIVQSYAMYILAYISASGGGASTLAGLTDTNIVSPSDRQYLKYNATSGKWENVSATKTFVKATPKMTGPTTPSGVVSASSEYNINYAAWYAFDGVYGYDQQTWATSGGHTSGEWIQYLFGSAKVIKKIATVNRNEANVRAIKTFIFQASNDGTNFTDLGTFQISSGTAAYRQEFTINNDTAYLYYRLYVVSPWISGDLTVGLAELELFEEVEVEVAELDDLVDVYLVALVDGQALVYDSALSKWVNNKAVGTAYGGTGNTDGYIRTGHRANTQIGPRATIEGQDNAATRENNHVEGYNNTTNNYDAHAEGRNNTVNGAAGHAEGDSTNANNTNAHSEGYATTASGTSSHAQNNNTTASGANSSAAGYFTTAGYENQFAIGKYNNNKSTSIFEVGIGTGTNAKANGLELDASGNLKTAGTITDGNGNVLGQPVAVDGVWVISGETATLTVTTP